MDLFSQTRSSDREPVAAGRFYSANKETMTNEIEQLFASCIKQSSINKVRAIISPHAGYVYS
ncbi:MAG: AmmeMemoRadiSam system protein B, partial [Bacteroidales bacterium]